MSPRAARESKGLPDRIGRELLILGCALAFGLLASPPLVWLVGQRAFGAYADGGLQALARNFFRGLADGSFGFWLVGLAPYAVVLLIRALIAIFRYAPAAQ